MFFSTFFLNFGNTVLKYIEDIYTRWSEDVNFIFEWQNNVLRMSAASKILFLPRENKIHIFNPPCKCSFYYIDKKTLTK